MIGYITILPLLDFLHPLDGNIDGFRNVLPHTLYLLIFLHLEISTHLPLLARVRKTNHSSHYSMQTCFFSELPENPCTRDDETCMGVFAVIECVAQIERHRADFDGDHMTKWLCKIFAFIIFRSKTRYVL
jgi:hypothetical protein